MRKHQYEQEMRKRQYEQEMRYGHFLISCSY
jgi:hypothetical protein